MDEEKKVSGEIEIDPTTGRQPSEQEAASGENQELASGAKPVNLAKSEPEEAGQPEDGEEFDPDFYTVPDRVEVDFKVTYEDVMKGLAETDKRDGTQRKNKVRRGMLLILAALELIAFMQTRNGFTLILALIFGGMAIYLQKRGMGINHQIAKAFEAEEGQSLALAPDGMEVTGKKVGYQEDVRVFDLEECFSLIYQKNHVFIIPKRLLTPEQRCGIERKLKGILGDAYE